MDLSCPPFAVWDCWWLAPLALALDLRFGDPDLPWRHPVCYLGNLLHTLEIPARQFMLAGGTKQEPMRGRLSGTIALTILTAVTGLLVWGLVSLPVLGTLMAVYLSWAGLAMGCLLSTGKEVLHRVEFYTEPEARNALSWLVSRETSTMDRPLMRKTLADTLSENLTDAFVAPFFWLLLFGPVGLWCYKAVSTTDSMWGYLTAQWRWLGWAGAKSDDILAFVPARLSIWFVRLVDILSRLYAAWNPSERPWTGHWPGVRIIAQQAKGMPSPNSGWSMAACAWMCGARMAGPSVYFGVYTHKPWLGPDKANAATWDAPRIETLCNLLRCCALYGGLALWLTLWMVGIVTGVL